MVRARVDCFRVSGYHEKFADAFSMRGNPASLTFCRSFTAGMYAERRFLLDGVRHFILAAAMPVGHDGLGLQLEHLAAAGYRQSAIAIGYAKKLGQAALGLQLHYNITSIDGYGRAGAMAVEVGSIWRITGNISLGTCLYLPAGGMPKGAYHYSTGLGFKVSDQLLIVVEAGMEESKPAGIHAALHYRPTPQCTIQLGMVTSNTQPYISSSLQWGTWRILLTVTYSMQLGPTPGFAFMYVQPQNGTP